jgi:hypothetical protein
VPSGARPTVGRVVTSILVATLGVVELSGQRQGVSRGGSSGSTSRPLSATVFASWSMHWSHTDGSTMALLVLWRGSPGWFARGASSGGSSGASGSSSGSSYQWLSQGGLTFWIEFDIERKIVKLLEREVDLTKSNVVLVDRVDAPDGPTIVSARWVEPAADALPPRTRSKRRSSARESSSNTCNAMFRRRHRRPRFLPRRRR